MNYYNEFDPFAAERLRMLIGAGLIAPGVVDERSIEDVRPSDLRGFTQCHFFAGIGVWPHALRSAGWTDDRPVWTGSCPCQPFSTAGKGHGVADKRHLWPHFFQLIAQCQPPVVLGEQVASAGGLAWLDLVCADLEGAGYAVGAADLCAAGFGAPHIRQRLYWVADLQREGLEGLGGGHQAEGRQRARSVRSASASGELGGVADSDHERFSWQHPRLREGQGDHVETSRGSATCLVDGSLARRLKGEVGSQQPVHTGGPTNGYWRDADWLACRDGKWRPVEPGTFPLAHGVAGRVGLLRTYGNAIVAPVAEAFIRAVM